MKANEAKAAEIFDEELQELREERDSFKRERDNLEQERDDLQRQRDILMEEKSQLEGEKAELQQEVFTALAEFEDCRRTLAVSASELDQTNAELIGEACLYIIPTQIYPFSALQNFNWGQK